MSNMRDAAGNWRKVAYVYADGPYSGGVSDYSGLEFPEWTVSVMDAQDDEIKGYTVRSYERTQELGEKIARDRGVEFVNDAGYA